MAALRPGCALSVFAWGAIGQIVASPADLDELAAAIASPSGALAPLAAYLTAAYGTANATIMTQTWSSAMRGILDAGGDISRSLAARIRCPALLVAGTYDEFCSPRRPGNWRKPSRAVSSPRRTAPVTTSTSHTATGCRPRRCAGWLGTETFVIAGVTEGCEVESGAGEEAVEQAGPVLHPFEPGLDQGGELGEVAFGQVGQRPLEVRPDGLDRVELVRVGGSR